MVRLTTPSNPATTQIQNALNGNAQVTLGPGTWNTGPLYGNANNTFELESGASLLAAVSLWPTAGPLDRYIPLFKVRDVGNVRVTGAGRMEVPADPAYGIPANRFQWRHCVALFSADSCQVDAGLTLTSRGGDGIYLGAAQFELPVINDPTTDTTIKNVTCDGCYRDGLTLIHVDGVAVSDSVFSDSTGIAGQAGIGVEPNQTSQYIRNVSISDCQLTGNAGYGFYLQMNKRPVEVEIEISGSRIEGGAAGSVNAVNVENAPATAGAAVLTLTDCDLYANSDAAFRGGWLAWSVVTLRRCTFHRLSGQPPLGDVRMYWDSGANAPWTPFLPADFGSVVFDDCETGKKNFRVGLSSSSARLAGLSGHIWRPSTAERVGNSDLWLLYEGRDGVPGEQEFPSGSVGALISKPV